MADSGRLADKLVRQVPEEVLAGEGGPEVMAVARGLEVVSNDSTLLIAVDEAPVANLDVTDKVRGGKAQATGVTAGVVIKVTHGQADVRRVCELVMECVQD